MIRRIALNIQRSPSLRSPFVLTTSTTQVCFGGTFRKFRKVQYQQSIRNAKETENKIKTDESGEEEEEKEFDIDAIVASIDTTLSEEAKVRVAALKKKHFASPIRCKDFY